MKSFDYSALPGSYLTPDIVAMLTTIHEHRGKQELFIEAHADALTMMVEVAKIQSIDASNRLEGIHTTYSRLKNLAEHKSEPRNRSEQEIAGYRDVLGLIHESYDDIPLRPGVILQLHRQLQSFAPVSDGGTYKRVNNAIAEKDGRGEEIIRFRPVSAHLTEDALDRLCISFNDGLGKAEYDALLLMPMFILDFLCIHPFRDGNGRMSRLLSLLLLYQSGYTVGKYISLEMLIESSKDTYYEALYDSSEGWHDNGNNYAPFIRYYLAVLIKAYREFGGRVEYLSQRGLTKSDRIKALIDRTFGSITKAEILATYPDISGSTVERTLGEMIKTGYLVKVGAGPSTAYRKVNPVS